MAKKTIISIKEKERRNRRIYVNKVKRFAKSKAGLKIIRKLAPQIAEMIENYPDYLEVFQWHNDPRLSGNYRVDICGHLFYTGESGNCVFRICEHVFNYCSGAESFGHKYDPVVPAKIDVFAWGVIHKDMRELIEARVIDMMHPVLQWTSVDAPEYGRDKPIPENESRETMRPDTCIYTNLRIDRFHSIWDDYKKEHGI